MTPGNKYLIALSGYIGSGKSTAAYYIASRLSAFLIVSDKYRSQISKKHGIDIIEANKSSYIQNEIKRIVKKKMKTLDNQYVVIDSCLTGHNKREFIKQLAKDNAYSVIFIQIIASEESIKKRIKERKVDTMIQFSGGTFDGYMQQKQEYEPWVNNDHIVIENTTTKEDLYHAIENTVLTLFEE